MVFLYNIIDYCIFCNQEKEEIEQMGTNIDKRTRDKNCFRVLYCALFCILFLSACEIGSQFVQKRREYTQEKKTKKIEYSSATQILAAMIKDEGFLGSIQRDAHIRSEDTEEEIYQKLQQCKTLTINTELIYSLEDLSLLPNLQKLEIVINSYNDSKINDFSPIAKLSYLEELYLHYEEKQEIDLSFLAQMNNIKALFLPYCQINDLSFLEKMPQLERLSLYEAPVEDLSVLKNLSQLRELALSGNAQAKNMEVIGKLSTLEDLGLQNCGIKDITFLSELTNLRAINLNGNKITDLSPLSKLQNLERLGVVGNNIEDITPLASLTNLFDLSLDQNNIDDISALTQLPHLNQLGLSDNNITDLSPLADKEELLYVVVYGNPYTNISPVWQVPFLFCTQQGVSDIEEKKVDKWFTKQHPELGSYVCIDYVEGDLNKDGMTDCAFVLDGKVSEEQCDYGCRRLFILLQQKDGSFEEVNMEQTPIIIDQDSMRGDPYVGMDITEGYLLLQMQWGSSTGGLYTNIYRYHEKELELVRQNHIETSHFAPDDAYVIIENLEEDSYVHYVIIVDESRMIRVDLSSSDNPSHKAFPNFYMDYSVSFRKEKIETKWEATTILDQVQMSIDSQAQKEFLPYDTEQKENYEFLVGVELPDYYYVIPQTANIDQVNPWEGDYIYYDNLIIEDEQKLHRVCYVKENERTTIYLIDDATREVRVLQ